MSSPPPRRIGWTSCLPSASSPCSPRLPSIHHIPSPTSRACRSTSPCWSATPRRAFASSPGSRCRQCSRFIPLAEGRYVALEDVIAHHLDQLFSGMQVVGHHTFRVTRNEDVEVEEDDAENLLLALEKEILRRKVGRPPVRLEVEDDMDPKMLELLISELDISEGKSSMPGPLDLRGLFSLADIDRAELKYWPFFLHPSPPRGGRNGEARRHVRCPAQRDVLLHHPYDSFATSVQRFIEQAADDPHVLAIKQTLYRTSGDSPIIDALIEASEAGKQVLALVEIKARFDEQANIAWARRLEQHGCHVVYGLLGLKTHCKLSMVVREEPTASAATRTSVPGTTTPRPLGCMRTLGCSPPIPSSPMTSAGCSTIFRE